MSKDKNWKQGRSATVECEADFYVDEYLEYATDEALLEEMVKRGMDLTKELDLDLNQKIGILISGLDIIKADKIKQMIELILKD